MRQCGLDSTSSTRASVDALESRSLLARHRSSSLEVVKRRTAGRHSVCLACYRCLSVWCRPRDGSSSQCDYSSDSDGGGFTVRNNAAAVMKQKAKPPMVYDSLSAEDLSNIILTNDDGDTESSFTALENNCHNIVNTPNTIIASRRNRSHSNSRLSLDKLSSSIAEPRLDLRDDGSLLVVKVPASHAHLLGADAVPDATSSSELLDDDTFPAFVPLGTEENDRKTDSPSVFNKRAIAKAIHRSRHEASFPSEDPEATLLSFRYQSHFSYVPPVVRFAQPSQRIARPSKAIRRQLRWCDNSLLPKVIRKTLQGSHFQVVPEKSIWIGYWGKHLRSSQFSSVLPHQMVNHFPGTFHLGRKDRLWTALYRMMLRHGYNKFNIMPKTYILPQDKSRLRLAMRQGKDLPANEIRHFIVKPPASARATGIRIVHRWSQVPKRQPVIAQVYIDRPFLINGYKFDLRLYVLVTSFNPLRLYMYEEGLVRFASEIYSTALVSFSNRFAHLTNYSVNKTQVGCNAGDEPGSDGHKWTLSHLWRYLAERGYNVRELMKRIVDLILKTILSCESSINRFIRTNLPNSGPHSCYELFGFDVVLDEALKPWLLEVNISPSLNSASKLDIDLKSKLAADVLNLAGIYAFDKIYADVDVPQNPAESKYAWHPHAEHDLSSAEREKHVYYVNKYVRDMASSPDILTALTPDDLRVLMTTEDEYSRRGHFSRLFPSPFSAAYMQYCDRPLYYNLLLDQWVQQYHHIRETGVNYLASLSSQRAHFPQYSSPENSISDEEGQTEPSG